MDHVSKLVETSKVPNAQSVQKVEWVSDAKNVRTVTLVIQGKVFLKKRLAGMPQWKFAWAALQKGQILGYWLKTRMKHFNPRGDNGPVRPCQKCDCNQNVDKDAIGNCDDSTGECLRCIDNTDGSHCEVCKAGFFGDALALKKVGDPPSCQVCQCYPIGTNHDETTLLPVCSPFTGDCSCKPQVVGRDCDRLVWFEIREQVFKSS